MLTFKFDNVKAVSVNALYVNIPGQARRFKSTAGKEFTSTITGLVEATILNNKLQDEVASLSGKRLKVTIKFQHNEWLTKAKTIRKTDVDSGIKATTDAVFSALSSLCKTLDDSQIFELLVSKESGDPCIYYTIEEI